MIFVVQVVPRAMMCDFPVTSGWPKTKRVRINEDPCFRTRFWGRGITTKRWIRVFVVQAVPLAMMCDLPVSLMWRSAKGCGFVRIRASEPRFWAVVRPGRGGPVFFVGQAVPLAMMCDLPVSLMWRSAKRVRIREDPRFRTPFLGRGVARKRWTRVFCGAGCAPGFDV